jgi:hypothetical protein
VGTAVLRQPQDSKRNRLHFAAALFFFDCFGVAHGFFSTRPASRHVELTAVWVWKHAKFVFVSTFLGKVKCAEVVMVMVNGDSTWK